MTACPMFLCLTFQFYFYIVTSVAIILSLNLTNFKVEILVKISCSVSIPNAPNAVWIIPIQNHAISLNMTKHYTSALNITLSNLLFPFKDVQFFSQLLRPETSQTLLTPPISSYLSHLSFPPLLSTALSRYQCSTWHVETIL